MPTTFPIDITIDRLVEFRQVINAIGLQEIGRLPSWGTVDDAVGEIMELMAFQGQTGEQLRAWLHDQAEAAAFRNRPTS